MLVLTASLLLLLKASFVASADDCDTVAANCIQNPSCNATFTAYLTACDRVLNSGLPGDCTADCLAKLNASNEMEPAFVTCNVTSPISQQYRANILKGCFATPAPPTATPSTSGFLCSTIGGSCSFDLNCSPRLNKYLSDCSGVFTGQPCTSACSSSTAALFEIWPAFRDCRCGSDQTCITAEPHVRACLGDTTAAPSPNFCSVWGLECFYDAKCKPLLDNYSNSCASLFAGSGCTAQCQSSIKAYQEYLPDSRNCVCGADSSCTANEGRVRSCVDSGPGVPQLCSALVEDGCGSDSTCKSIVETYLDSCAKVFESNVVDCAAECKGNLERAVAALPPLETCICGGNRTCSKAQVNIQIACYDLTQATPQSCSALEEACSKDSACNSLLTKYLTSCGSVLSSGEASDCSQACRDDLKNLVLSSPDFEMCVCPMDDADCTTKQTKIQMGCFPEASSKADKVATAVSTLALVVLAFIFI
ncbi:protein eyes shut homolog [Oscarella lobularis]|uniref:protein eyes shut homolog n=1 Tax=Oscarella lobularis TaxID=121494 RepID=UPI00331402DE